MCIRDRLDEEGGRACDLRQGAGGRDDNGAAAGHRLKRWETEAFVRRWPGEAGGARIPVTCARPGSRLSGAVARNSVTSINVAIGAYGHPMQQFCSSLAVRWAASGGASASEQRGQTRLHHILFVQTPTRPAPRCAKHCGGRSLRPQGGESDLGLRRRKTTYLQRAFIGSASRPA